MPQYAGVKVDGTQCKPTDIIPKYNVTMEQVLELQNLCVDYAKPRFLMKEQIIQPTSVDSSAALNQETSSISSALPSTTTSSVASINPRPSLNTNEKDTPRAGGNLRPPAAPGRHLNLKESTLSATKTIENTSSQTKSTETTSIKENVASQSTTTTTTTTTTCTLWQLQASPTETENGQYAKEASDTKKHEHKVRGYTGEEKGYAVAEDPRPAKGSKGKRKDSKEKAPKGKVSRASKNYSLGKEIETPKYVKPPSEENVVKTSYRKKSTENVDNICPRRLSERWARMQGKNYEKFMKTQAKVYNYCEELKDDIKNRKPIEALPEFDHDERPLIRPCNGSVVPKSKKKGKSGYGPLNEMAGIEFQNGAETPMIGLMALLALFTNNV